MEHQETVIGHIHLGSKLQGSVCKNYLHKVEALLSLENSKILAALSPSISSHKHPLPPNSSNKPEIREGSHLN
jgi:hypothetical protein